MEKPYICTKSSIKGLTNRGGSSVLLEPPHWRPETFNDLSVPEVLLSGNHKDIEEWKKNNLKDI